MTGDSDEPAGTDMMGHANADFEVRLAALTPEKRTRFDQLLREALATPDIFPLSVPQRALWLREQNQPCHCGHVMPVGVRVRGGLDLAALVASVNDVVRRHEVLRTTIGQRDAEPVQVVRRWHPIDIPCVEVGGGPLDTAALEERVRQAAIGEPMDLGAGPLIRFTLLRVAPDDIVLAIAWHHLVGDRTSFGLFLSELGELYQARREGRDPRLAHPRLHYGDFAVWQEEQCRQGRWGGDLEFWRTTLAGAPATLRLPTDRPRPAVQGCHGDRVPFEVEPELMRSLSSTATSRWATIYMALLAVYAIVLYRGSGQSDLVVAAPTVGRGRPELESLFGYLVNTVPMRCDLSGNPTFLELLDRVRRVCLDAHDHQSVPFDLVMSDLKVPHDPSRMPVHQVSFSHGRHAVPAFRVGDTEFSRVVPARCGSRYDLELRGYQQQDGRYSGRFEYDTDLFDRSTVERFARRFQDLLERVAADPGQRVDDLVALNALDRRRRARRTTRAPRAIPPGPVIVLLNGISSAGKTTLAKALQDTLPRPYLSMGMDIVYAALPRRYMTEARCLTEVLRCQYDGDQIRGISATPYGDRLVCGMHRAVAALATAGLNVIVDHGVIEPRWWADMERAWAGLDVLRVGVLCAVEVAEERERVRGDRIPGWARAHTNAMHAGIRYDLTVDTSRDPLAVCASAIASMLTGRTPPGGGVADSGVAG